MSLIEFDHITKRFGGTLALDAVSLAVEAGECHALMGENGAGKSTLGKILSGIHRPDAGEVRIGGMVRHFRSSADSREAGVGIVHQELAFCPDLTVGENLLLGRLPRRFGFFVDGRASRKQAGAFLRTIAPEIDAALPMRALSVAQRQLVQIAGAVGGGATILVFDEPTSSLGEAESQRLFALMADLRTRGVTIIYVSHRMPEVFAVADRISVLRDGRFAGTLQRAEATQDGLIGMMIGRAVLESQTAGLERAGSGRDLLQVRGLSSPGRFRDISFSIQAGEIAGMAGLVGSGRSEIAQALFGLDPASKGSVILDGKDVSRASTRRRMDAGLALVPEDRQHQGLALPLSCRHNFSLPLLRRLTSFSFLNRKREDALLHRYFTMLRIKAPSHDSRIAGLSGGNQQKVVLAKWLAREAKVLLLDEPTRGVDIGAKTAIQSLILELARRGLAILLISSELSELLALSTRVLVVREGTLAGALPRAHATQEELLKIMSGLSSGHTPTLDERRQ